MIAWNKIDIFLQITFYCLLTFDCRQTNIALSQKEWVMAPNGQMYYDYKYDEMNPILGNRPSSQKLIIYDVGIAATHTVITCFLPQPYRKIWQFLAIGIETSAITNNFIRIGFKNSF